MCTALVVLLVALVVPGAEPTTIPHFKELRTVTVDPERVAVLSTAGPSLAARLDAAVDPEGPALPPGWGMYHRRSDAGALTNPDDSGRAALERVALADPETQFVSPILLSEEGWRIVTPELVLRFTPETSREECDAVIAASLDATLLERDAFGLDRCYRLRLHTSSGLEALAIARALAQLDSVRFAEPDMIMSAEPALATDDPFFGEQWALENLGQIGCAGTPGTVDVDMDVPEAWLTTRGDASLIVLVIDNGVEFDHPDLMANPALGFDATGQGGAGWPVHPCDDHGTAIAGVIGAISDNGIGTAGVAEVTLASARISTVNASCSSWTIMGSWVADAMEFGLSIGMRLTNTSYVFPSSALIDDAYANANALGVLHIAGAGNSGGGQVLFPANLPTVMAVSAIDSSGAKASFSSFGPGLALTGPGVNIRATDRTGAEGYDDGDACCISGTSLSSPCVAGVAALIFAANPSLTNDAARIVLFRTAVDLGAPGYDTSFGWGLPNAALAVAAALQPADLDLDGEVDGADLGVLLAAWGSSNPVGDIDGSGTIDGADLGLLLASWSMEP